jgi:LysM repeat protein
MERSVCPLGDTYTVREGDTLQRIARGLGITQRALIAQNPLVDPLRLQPGQVLCVPRGAGPGPAQPPPAPQPQRPAPRPPQIAAPRARDRPARQGLPRGTRAAGGRAD